MDDKEIDKLQHSTLSRWSIENSSDLYGIQNWGKDYFSITPEGNVQVCTNTRNGKKGACLIDIISGIKERGIDMPVLIRVEDLLDARISSIHEAFNEAIKKFNYMGKYRGVYPIKVNQQQQVIEEVTRFGSRYHHGLEAGSKAELVIAIAMLNDPEACIVCNGYKDSEFIDLALYAMKLGHRCFIVLEMLSELELILERAEQLGVRPKIGVRIKLSAKASGHWTDSGGARSFFGLNTTEIITVIDILKNHSMLDCLQLLHYHIGSQIPNIRDIRNGVTEACRIYAEIVLEGAPMGFLDLGGGLAVDYDGSQTNFPSSKNYSIDEYCADIIEIVMGSMDDKKIPHPNLITESGRATVAYYSILLFNVLEVSKFETPTLPESLPKDSHEMLRNMMEVYNAITVKNIQECYNDALYYNDELQQLFRVGRISMRERATGENIFWNIIQKIAKTAKKLKETPIELEDIDSAIADIYYCNFSVFQSLPDSWAIDHLFPIMPIHRLVEPPTRKAVISDITCDCDGKIDKFIDLHDVRHTLPVHELRDNEEYYIGVFLVGAYQETLGDLHNLYGDTNVVSLRINDDGSYDFARELEGDSVSDVLSYVEYDPKELLEKFREKAEFAVKNNQISVKERRTILDAYENGLRGYTYFER